MSGRVDGQDRALGKAKIKGRGASALNRQRTLPWHSPRTLTAALSPPRLRRPIFTRAVFPYACPNETVWVEVTVG